MNTAEPCWLDAGAGARFCLLHRPRTLRGVVIHLHPFAEEMNRCRRMAALMSRRLASDGWLVVQVDLHGCGDSAGEFGDATLDSWHDDLRCALEHALAQAGASVPVWLWAVRGGALLIPALLASYPRADLLLWQPVVAGNAQLSQFLRLKVAAQSLAGGERIDGGALRRELERSGSLEVAGYGIGAKMASQLENARLDLTDGHRPRVIWVELASRSGELSPASQQLCRRWLAAGVPVTTVPVEGPPFWQTQETTEAPQFIETSLAALHDGAIH